MYDKSTFDLYTLYIEEKQNDRAVEALTDTNLDNNNFISDQWLPQVNGD